MTIPMTVTIGNVTNPVRSSPTNATIADGQGTGTILDDEPRISINDVTATEGKTGAVNAIFTVSLSVAFDVAVTVHYQTANGSATAGSAYAAKTAHHHVG